MFAEEKPVPLQAPKDVLDGLRWYQRDVHTAVMKAFETHNSVLVDLATGLGKTQVFSAIAKTWPGRVLVLAHRDELVQQARMRLEKMTGELVEVEQGNLKSNRARIVVGSVQTVYRPERLERLIKLGGFTLVIPDEAHHYVSETGPTGAPWARCSRRSPTRWGSSRASSTATSCPSGAARSR
jgi:superfamily II DNA or RNA helicase